MDKADSGGMGDAARRRLASCLVIIALTSSAHGEVAQRRKAVRAPSRLIAQPCSQQATGLLARTRALTRSLRGVVAAREAVVRSDAAALANRLAELQSSMNGLNAAAALVRNDGLKWSVVCGSKSLETRTLQEIDAVNGEIRAALNKLAYIERPSRLNPNVARRSIPVARAHGQSADNCHANVSVFGRCRPQGLNSCRNCCNALPPDSPGRAQCVRGCQTSVAQCTLDSMQCGHAGACRAQSAPPACDLQACSSCCNSQCPGGALCPIACDLQSTLCLLDGISRRPAASPSVFGRQ